MEPLRHVARLGRASGRRLLRALLVVCPRGVLPLLVVAATVPTANATGTDPELALHSAVAQTGTTVRVVRLMGYFPADDLVQIPYPLQVVVHEAGGGQYVRYDLSGAAVSGMAPALADGLDAADALALLGEGAPSPDATVLFLGNSRIEVRLPASFPTGGAVAQLFVLYKGEAILSNPLTFGVEAGP